MGAHDPVVEEDIDKVLRHLCVDEKITKEVWFKAAYQYLAEHPKAIKVMNGHRKEVISAVEAGSRFKEVGDDAETIERIANAKPAYFAFGEHYACIFQ